MYLGIDLGTSAVKAMLVDDCDAIVGEEQAALAVSRPHANWSEQNPADWRVALETALDALKARHPSALAATRGIGLSGQMHGAVLLDETDAPLRPCILWTDGRSTQECAELEAAAPDLRNVAGNIAMPGFTAPKLAWTRKHEPEIFRRTRKVLLPKAYLRLLLTGEMAEDMSDASGTLWLDVGRRDWSDALLDATGLTRAHMPRLVEGNEATGRLRPVFAERWGMTASPVVAGGAGDNAASAIGVGAVSSGDAFVSLGTSGVLWATTDRFRPNPGEAVHAFCHALPSLWHQMGVILSAAASLEWWASVNGVTPNALIEEIGGAARAPGGVLFAPFLSGERTPHNDAAVRGAFIGLSHNATRAQLTQAVLEGVAFAFRDCLDVLTAAGTQIASAIAVGGGSRSLTWLSILAAALELPLQRPTAGAQGAAFGAARLGRMAAMGEPPQAVCTTPAIEETIEPDPTLAALYRDAHRRYRALYPALRQMSS